MEYVADTNILLVLILLGIIHVIQAPSAVTFLIFFSPFAVTFTQEWNRHRLMRMLLFQVCKQIVNQSFSVCVCVCAYTDTGHVCEYIYISGQVCVSVDSLWVCVCLREREID